MRPTLRTALLCALLLPAGLACSRSRVAPRPASAPVPAPAASPVESYSLRLGQATYRHYCQTCHGDTGGGDGFNAYNLDPHPRNLADPAFQKSHKDADLEDAIRRGGAGVGLSPLMPPWGRTLSPRQIEDVVAYIRTFRPAS